MKIGKPIESRPPQKSDDKPAFPRHTRAPYQAIAPFNTTILSDKLQSPLSLAFLPDGKILLTEKPGTMGLMDKAGKLSEPSAGIPTLFALGQVDLLDLALDPRFATSKRLLFTYCEPVGASDSSAAR